MSAPARPEPLIDARVRLDSLPATGRTLTVTASEAQRQAIAERLAILSVDHLTASLVARPLRGGIEVSGTFVADLTQACVVSFEPVPEHVEESLFRLFLQGHGDAVEMAPGAEVYVDLDGEDLPDRFDGPEADLSEWLIETLALALDPYPRKPGIEVDPAYRDDTDGTDDTASPFDALKSLKPTNE